MVVSSLATAGAAPSVSVGAGGADGVCASAGAGVVCAGIVVAGTDVVVVCAGIVVARAVLVVVCVGIVAPGAVLVVVCAPSAPAIAGTAAPIAAADTIATSQRVLGPIDVPVMASGTPSGHRFFRRPSNAQSSAPRSAMMGR